MYRRLVLTITLPIALTACGTQPAPTTRTVSHSSPVGAASPMVLSQQLRSEHGSSVTGTATVTTSDPSFTIRLQVAGLRPSTRHPSHIHAGACGSSGPVVFPLEVLTADGTGDAVATTVIRHAFNVPARGWYVCIHQGPAMTGAGDTPVACADLRRFLS